MEFHVTLDDAPPDLPMLEKAFRSLDPAAVVDMDPTGHTLRIAAAVGTADVRILLAMTGCVVPLDRIEPQPSVCCGGCSG
jgi:hypothetical protein